MTAEDLAADAASHSTSGSDALPAYFTVDGDSFVPTALSQGPWGSSVSGMYVGGILAHAIERDTGDPDLRPTRLTVDLLRPAALQPLTLRTTIIRNGRRLRLVDADMFQGDKIVARASAIFARPGDQPPEPVWTSPVTMPSLPPPPENAARMQTVIWAFGRDTEPTRPSQDLDNWRHDGPKHAWLRNVTPLLAGEPMTPFVRAAMAGDVTSSLTNFGPGGMQFINADYTLTLCRLPDGPDIGLAALTHYSHAGLATGTTALFDRHGPIGSGVATALVNPGFAPPHRART